MLALSKRLDFMQSDGVEFDLTLKVSVFSCRAMLQQDKEESDKNSRLEEQNAKMRQTQANMTTPKTTLMKLSGFLDWVPWLHQLQQFSADITREQSKVALVVNSLKVKEDIDYLAGSTSYKEIMLYLRKKYHRSEEVASSILAQA